MDSESGFLVTIAVDKPFMTDLGRRYFLSPLGTTLGNGQDVDIPLKINSPLPCHIKIHLEEGGEHGMWYLSDLAEFSKVYVNNLLVQSCRIFDGDIIRIESLSLEFCSGRGEKVLYFEQIESLLQEDFLTRAYNRNFLINLLNLEILRYNRWILSNQKDLDYQRAQSLSVIFLDVDHFGQINKLYGHSTGDEILKELVLRIKSRIRSTDIVARYGGEEFALVLLDTPMQQAVLVAEDIRNCISKSPFNVENYPPINVTISGGISELKPKMDLSTLLETADLNMRTAKTQGRNCIVHTTK